MIETTQQVHKRQLNNAYSTWLTKNSGPWNAIKTKVPEIYNGVFFNDLRNNYHALSTENRSNIIYKLNQNVTRDSEANIINNFTVFLEVLPNTEFLGIASLIIEREKAPALLPAFYLLSRESKNLFSLLEKNSGTGHAFLRQFGDENIPLITHLFKLNGGVAPKTGLQTILGEKHPLTDKLKYLPITERKSFFELDTEMGSEKSWQLFKSSYFQESHVFGFDFIRELANFPLQEKADSPKSEEVLGNVFYGDQVNYIFEQMTRSTNKYWHILKYVDPKVGWKAIQEYIAKEEPFTINTIIFYAFFFTLKDHSNLIEITNKPIDISNDIIEPFKRGFESSHQTNTPKKEKQSNFLKTLREKSLIAKLSLNEIEKEMVTAYIKTAYQEGISSDILREKVVTPLKNEFLSPAYGLNFPSGRLFNSEEVIVKSKLSREQLGIDKVGKAFADNKIKEFALDKLEVSNDIKTHLRSALKTPQDWINDIAASAVSDACAFLWFKLLKDNTPDQTDITGRFDTIVRSDDLKEYYEAIFSKTRKQSVYSQDFTIAVHDIAGLLKVLKDIHASTGLSLLK